MTMIWSLSSMTATTSPYWRSCLARLRHAYYIGTVLAVRTSFAFNSPGMSGMSGMPSKLDLLRCIMNARFV